MQPKSSYDELVEIARICAKQAHITTSKDVARELWRMAQRYQQKAAELNGGKSPDIGDPPEGLIPAFDPIYLFGVDNERPSLASYKSLPDDRAACEWAKHVTRELNRNRHQDWKMLTVKAYRRDGTLVDPMVQ